MEVHIALAVMGAMLGATLGQIKGEAIADFLFKRIKVRAQSRSRLFRRNNTSDETLGR
ncbi:MAG TPA: hypothetical protein VNO70_25250 [Blastocatellia bacterium]|nr:hypothetical protein [Blastocatellia bacterium]